MNIRIRATLIACLMVGTLFAAPSNIILIYTDDHGWPDIGSAGIYDDLKTPHIDALAASGVRATSGYSTAPQCIPSRAGLLIGKSQNRFGVESNGLDLAGFDAEQTIAERLKKAGYATGQIGKWHLGKGPDIPSHGFDDVYNKNANRPCAANFTLAGKTIPMQQVDDQVYHLDACSQAALAFIDRHANEPFFLYLAYRAPHVPLDAPKKYLDRFPGEMPERRRQCLAMLASMDDGIGLIRADLKKRGLLEKTLIFYIGDNGAPLKITKLDAPGGGPGWDGSLNEPMNGEKGMLTEGGIRVPFLVSFPGTIPGGQVVDTPLISLDVAATSLALAGLDPDPRLDGRNILPLLSRADKTLERPLYWRWIAQAAIREGNWKFLQAGARSYLFNLAVDKEEKHNLLAQHPETASRLKAQLANWADELQPPGLHTAAMSPTWEKYYDFYLEGKEVTVKPAVDTLIKDWVGRNCTVNHERDGLQVSQHPDNRKIPFIACAKLKVAVPARVRIRLRSVEGGEVGVAWRLAGQADFVAGQRMTSELAASKKEQAVQFDLPAKETVIHLRVHLPKGASVVHEIAVEADRGPGKSWHFDH